VEKSRKHLTKNYRIKKLFMISLKVKKKKKKIGEKILFRFNYFFSLILFELI
jgi:hypothetical protein